MNKLLLTALLATLPFTATAHETRSADLTIQHPWSRVMPAASANGAAYFLIENTGKQADRLLSAQTPRAKKAELHTHIHDNGVMRMREVEGGVAIPAGQSVKFAPGGLHVMLMGLNSPLQKGEHFPLTLKFERKGEVKLDVVVEDGMPAAMPMQH